MNNIRRYISYFVLAVLAVWLWNTWKKEHPDAPPAQQAVTATTQESRRADDFTPAAFNPGKKIKQHLESKTVEKTVSAAVDQNQLIHIKNDVLSLAINPNGGDIVSAKLMKYTVSTKNKNPVQLLSSQSAELYKAQSGLIGSGDKASERILFSTSKKDYVMQPNQTDVVVELKGRTKSGLLVTKQFVLHKGSYQVYLSYDIKNQSGKTWNGSLYTQLVRRKPEQVSHHFMRSYYTGAAISSKETPYEKLPFKDFIESPISRDNQGGWVAMEQHYFLSAFIPETQSQINHYYTHVNEPADGSNPIYTIGFVSPAMTIAPGKTASSSASLYVGPELPNVLKNMAPGLDHTIDYGWLWPISIIIFWILAKVHWVVGNWGWSIVITTVLIKLAFHHLTAKTLRHGQLMRELQPKIKALKERHGDDRQALSKATMELHKQEGINPLGGCLPMLIQFPVFIALYYVLIESVQLRQAPWIFWIHDLSAKDPYYILPILMGVSMFVQQKLTPNTMDPNQQKIMMVLPVVFTVVFLNFPAGLALYWLVSNLVQIGQQWYVLKTHDSYKAKKEAKRKRKKRR